MKKSIHMAIVFSLAATFIAGCNGGNDFDTMRNSTKESSASYEENNFSETTSYEASSSKTIEHYCEVDGCYDAGTKTITGFSGDIEYYCWDHYNEMQDTISDMEKKFGGDSLSSHQCEACSKEGTHKIVGLSGATEYYCTEHYTEMVEILNMLLEGYEN